MKNYYSANCHYAGSVVLPGLYGHYAYADVLQLQVHSSRRLFFGLLARMDSVKESAKAIGLWILHDIIYRWGIILGTIMDNGPIFLAALCWLEKHYHIKHIRISRYNSHVNRLVKCSHYEVREAVFKACDRDETQWSRTTYSIFWAEQVTIQQWMGFSPFFGAHRTHPLLPLDITESKYLLPPSHRWNSLHVAPSHSRNVWHNCQNYITRYTMHVFKQQSSSKKSTCRGH
jgi:hypothetical protein